MGYVLCIVASAAPELAEELAEILMEDSALVRDLNSNGQDDGEPELAIPDEEAVDWDEPEDEPVEETEAGCELEVGLRAFLPETWIEKAETVPATGARASPA